MAEKGSKYSLAHPKELPDGRTVWVQCGTAYQKGDRISILMTSIPIDFDGQLWLFPKEDAEELEGPQPPKPEWKPEWKPYVPRTHKRAHPEGRDRNRTACGHHATADHLADEWGDVTCKNCLKRKDRGK